MSTITEEYLGSLAPLYKDILSAFPKLEPYRKRGYGLAIVSLYEGLGRKYTLGEITQACEEMEKGKAVVIKDGFFVCPTDIGEEIITGLTGNVPGEERVPPFVPPPGK